jgi:1-acyl-sn-glycerol-3-phosphate acyltransferase
MKVLRNILGKIFAVWAIIIFTVTLFIIIIPICITFLIKDPVGNRMFTKITKFWMNLFLPFAGCPLKVIGKHHFKKGENYVVVCNHNSLMDVPLTTPFIPGANKTIAKKSMAKTPVFGLVYIKGAVLVDRDSDASRRKSFEDMKQVLKKGLHMVIYPEGTRNRTSEPLKTFYDGAFKLAVNAEKDIIPTLLFNTKKVLPPNKGFYFWPHKLEMHFLPAVPVKDLQAKELKEKVFKIMWEYYERKLTVDS